MPPLPALAEYAGPVITPMRQRAAVRQPAPEPRPTPEPKHTAKRRASPTSAKHEDRRTQILRTAAQLFAAHGYEATSLDRIADQLGRHKATLYHYVDNKDSLLYECLVKSFGDLDAVMQRMRDRSLPVIERLRLFVRSLAVAQNNDFGRCLVLVGSRPLDLAPGNSIRQFQRRLDSTVRELINEGIADGSIRNCDPGLFCALLFGALNWVPHWHREAGRLSVRQVVDGFMDMLTEGIASGQALGARRRSSASI